MKKVKKIIRIEDGKIYIKLPLGELCIDELLYIGTPDSEADMYNSLSKHSDYYVKVSMQKDDLQYKLDCIELKIKEMREKSKILLSDISSNIRVGRIDTGVKVTDNSVKDFSISNRAYKDSIEEIYEMEKKYLKIRKQKDLCSSLVKAMEHKKDAMIATTYFARNKLRHDVDNLKRMIEEIYKER